MLLVCRSDSLSALARMEKWRERKEALPEYEKVRTGGGLPNFVCGGLQGCCSIGDGGASAAMLAW